MQSPQQKIRKIQVKDAQLITRFNSIIYLCFMCMCKMYSKNDKRVRTIPCDPPYVYPDDKIIRHLRHKKHSLISTEIIKSFKNNTSQT